MDVRYNPQLHTCRPDWHWEWIGNSLHPYYEGNDPAAMIDDDALIQATLQHWHWGEDGSGDIRRPANVEAICQSAKAMTGDLGTAGALLVTADGSVDCQENPNEQVRRSTAQHSKQQPVPLCSTEPPCVNRSNLMPCICPAAPLVAYFALNSAPQVSLV